MIVILSRGWDVLMTSDAKIVFKDLDIPSEFDKDFDIIP